MEQSTIEGSSIQTAATTKSLSSSSNHKNDDDDDDNNTNNKYSSFIFVIHEHYGMILLYCTRKKKKGPHYQIPGGHLDEADFHNSSIAPINSSSDGITVESTRKSQAELLQQAGKVGGTRELYEETGIDLRTQLDRIHPLPLYDEKDTEYVRKQILINEYKHRLFYVVIVTDDDFITKNNDTAVVAMGVDKMYNFAYDHLRLQLSVEHSGYRIEQRPVHIYSYIQLHSGGNIAKAFAMAFKCSSTCTSCEVQIRDYLTYYGGTFDDKASTTSIYDDMDMN